MNSVTHSHAAARHLARKVLFRMAWCFTLVLVALGSGFIVFATYVSTISAGTTQPADGIVALTGDEDRISEALKLLAEGKAGRLLISGVNKATNSPQLIGAAPRARETAVLFRCCVDLDKRALNTEDNAAETTLWAKKKGFHSLILVTSTYHMPRALIELRQSMPDVEILPYPVKSSRLEAEWWSDPETSWVLCKEYLKFITASVRYAAYSLTGWRPRQQSQQRTINARLG
jgi:uncharacterized SAM-binding protein YcdF (DUF218 family)